MLSATSRHDATLLEAPIALESAHDELADQRTTHDTSDPSTLRAEVDDTPDPQAETPPPGESNAIEIRVHVQVRVVAPEQQPRPDTAVVVGITERAYQAAGAEGPTKRVLARGHTDADGIAEFRILVSDADLHRWKTEAWFFAQIVEPGLQANARAVRQPTAGVAARIDLNAVPGVTLVGRIFDVDGQPVSRGEARLYSEGKHALPGPRGHSKSLVGHNGSFDLSMTTAGTYDLYVSSEGSGSRVVRALQLDGIDGPHSIEVHLEGGGEISGVLRDPDGTPLPFQRLSCVPESHRDFTLGRLEPDDRTLAESGEGTLGARYTTDAKGQFEFSALIPGSYRVRAWSDETRAYSELLTERPVSTDTRDLQLVLAHYRLHVRVIDQLEQPVELWPDQQPHWLSPRPHALYVEECDDAGRVLAPRRHPIERRLELPDGRLSVPVRAGHQYVVGVLSKRCELVERRIAISPDQLLTDMTIQVPEPSPPTGLRWDLQYAPGTPELDIDDLFDVEVSVTSIASGRLLWECKNCNPIVSAPLDIGPGSYHLTVRLRPKSTDAEGGLIEPTVLINERISLQPGVVFTIERLLPRPAVPEGAATDQQVPR
jgi:hypothetical protein